MVGTIDVIDFAGLIIEKKSKSVTSNVFISYTRV